MLWAGYISKNDIRRNLYVRFAADWSYRVDAFSRGVGLCAVRALPWCGRHTPLRCKVARL